MPRVSQVSRALACFLGSLLFAVSTAVAARTHVVKRGETLSSIAADYDVAVVDLARANHLRDADLVKLGQKLVIPDQAGASWTGTHKVRAGDTLSTIAAQYGVSTEELAQANHLRNADMVRRGQKLLVPEGSASGAPWPQTPAAVENLEHPSEATTHKVRKGESLSTIAAAYGVTVHDLATANHLRDADLVLRGQQITIPPGAPAFIEHRVARGESLAVIAHRYHVALADIRAANTLRNPNHIEAGQILRIPASDTEDTASAPQENTADPRHRLPSAIRAAIDSAKVTPGRWKYIIIHHSGTDMGSGKSMDRYHREERHMENGLAYHFVIGNGRGMTDGSIFVGRRWNEQLDGGHVAIPALNHVALGICLVGDFENGPPSRRQMQSLDALVRALLRRTGLTPGAVTTHRLAHPKHTLCPGKYFPYEHFVTQLRAK